MRRFIRTGWVLLVFLMIVGCESADHPYKYPPTPLRVDGSYLRDGYGRYVFLHGVNVSGTTKVPTSTDPVSYIGRPFPLEEADHWFGLLKDLGFNSIRLLTIWEAVEHKGRGVYDEEYLDYLEQIIAKAREYGIYVLINMHENMFSRYFHVYYSDPPVLGGDDPSNPLYILGSFFPDPETLQFTDVVTGDGAPRWAVEACVPEKDLDAPSWGYFRIIGMLNQDVINSISALLGVEIPPATLLPILVKLYEQGIVPFDVYQTSDVMPWTNWGLNMALSIDVERCYAAFFAGDKVFPKYKIAGLSVKDYLQEAFAGTWRQIVARAKKYENVIGYDVMNEPPGFFILLSAVAAYVQAGFNAEAVQRYLVDLLGEEKGEAIFTLVQALKLLPQIPPDATEEERREILAKWGLDKIDFLATLDLNFSFERNYLLELYKRVGTEILKEDPNAILWLEEGITPTTLFGDMLGGNLQTNLYKPPELPNVVFTPHWYPDIYPYPGFNQRPRKFVVEEWTVRDFKPFIEAKLKRGRETFGVVPIVFGEFGTYFNFNISDYTDELTDERLEGYEVAAEILDNYFEAFEATFTSHILWCFSADNTYAKGEQWNREDFSIIDPEGKPRAEKAYVRPYPRALSGRPVSMHFYSDYHNYEPDEHKGEVLPFHEFYLEFESKETDAPTEIFVPRLQYPYGFYVWLSDGWCTYDAEDQILYYFPTEDRPGWHHKVRILPPLEGLNAQGWALFVDSSGRQVSRSVR